MTAANNLAIRRASELAASVTTRTAVALDYACANARRRSPLSDRWRLYKTKPIQAL